jgi:hypothetical protein
MEIEINPITSGLSAWRWVSPWGANPASVYCADRVSQYSAQGLADALEPQALMEVCGIHPNFSINFLGASK